MVDRVAMMLPTGKQILLEHYAMSLNLTQMQTLIHACTTGCSTSIKLGMTAKEHGTMSERLVPILLLIKGYLNETPEHAPIFRLTMSAASLFGYKVTKITVHNAEALAEGAQRVASDLETYYRHRSFDEFVRDVRELLRQSDSFEGLNIISFARRMKALCNTPSDAFIDPELAKQKIINDMKYRMKQLASSEDIDNDTGLNVFEVEVLDVDTEVDADSLRERGDAGVQEFLDNCAYILSSKRKEAEKGKKKYECVIDEQVLFAALTGCHTFTHACAKAFNVPSLRIRFPAASAKYRANALDNIEPRTFSTRLSSGRNYSTDFFANALETCKSSLTFCDEALKIMAVMTSSVNNRISFSLSQQRLARALAQIDTGHWGTDYPYMLFKDFITQNMSAADTSPLTLIAKSTAFLRKAIIGQTSAVDKVSAHISSLILNGGQKHLGISTFFGVSGTGKTHLAELVGDVFTEVLGAHYQTVVFNMETYSSERDASRLFGSGAQYVDSALGQLTLAAIKNPRTIFVFDEIEKAHPNVIQSLLTPLDKGYAVDDTSTMRVNMSQCYFVFTTNVGSDSLSRTKDGVNLDPLELLTTASSTSTHRFSPEMANRLAAGNIAVFKSLKPHELVRIALNTRIATSNASVIPPAHPSELLLLTLGADASPRTLASQWRKIEGEVLNAILKSFSSSQLSRVKTITFDENPLVELPNTTTLHVIADVKLDNIPQGVRVFSGSPLSAIHAFIESEDKAILIDMDAMNENVGGLRSILNSLADKYIFTCSAGNEACNDGSLFHSPSFVHHFCLPKKNAALMFSIIKDVLRQVALIERVEALIEQHAAAEFSFAYELKETLINVSVKGLSYVQRIKKADAELPFLDFAEKPNCTLDDMIGMEQEKALFRCIINGLTADKKHNVPLPSGYLLAGPPGTGKTQMARCVAGESGLFFFGVDAANLLVGNVVENINQLFSVARRYAPSIIFIDEFDAIGMCRKASGHFNSAAVNTLLTAMQGFSQDDKQVFVLAATNHPQIIDAALIRPGRFDKVVHFKPPCEIARRACIKKWAEKHKVALDETLIHEIAQVTQGATVGQIWHVMNDSVLATNASQQDWHSAMLREAFRSARLGKLSLTTSLSEEDKRTTAYHEAGHLVASKLLLPHVPVEMVSIQPRGDALGMVVHGKAEKLPTMNKKHVKSQIQVLLAGIAAEHMLGLQGEEQTIGATKDREMATRLAKQAILDWGMSDQYGLALPSELNLTEKDVMPEVIEWLQEAYAGVKKLLVHHEELLNVIAQALLQHELLEEKDITNLFEQHIPNEVRAAA